MWKNYSYHYLKNNKTFNLSVIVAALISSLLLSMFSCQFYNIWRDDIRRIIQEEGSWQGRIVGDIGEEELSVIRSFANVKDAVINPQLSGAQGVVVDICFENMRTVFWDMPLIAEKLGLEEDAFSYHHLLLSRYLIHDPADETPPLLLSFYIFILLMVSFSLILIIHNAFAISMNTRMYQFGIFSSIGATPRQILICLIQEAAALCAVPILAGCLLGIALSFGMLKAASSFAAELIGTDGIIFVYHPLVFVIAITVSFFTVICSAWIPAARLSRFTPLEAIHNVEGSSLKRKKRSPILFALFGIEGELAGNALKAQKKAWRTSTLSLTLSFLGFSLMMSFFALSRISTDYTYFTRYQDAWDIMAVVKDVKIDNFCFLEELRQKQEVQSGVAYRKTEGSIRISGNVISDEVRLIGGPEALFQNMADEEEFYTLPSQILVLDDGGFLEYCKQLGVQPRLDGTILLNRVWDSIHSNFRNRELLPYIKETQDVVIVQNTVNQEKSAEVSVLAYTSEAPVLREEYDDYALVQFMSVSCWNMIAEEIENINTLNTDIYIRVLASEEAELAGLQEIEGILTELLDAEFGSGQEKEVENRIQEKISNDRLIFGYEVVMGAICMILAMIGIANVFSNTLGFLRLRKREFAQYMSVGLSPSGFRKLFLIEMSVIAGRPLLITLPLTALSVELMIKAGFINPMEFIRVAPVLPIGLFYLAIFAFVALAYAVGGKKVLRAGLAETLKSDI